MVGCTSDQMDMGLRKLREVVKDREDWRPAVHGLQRVRHDLATEQQLTTPIQDHILHLLLSFQSPLNWNSPLLPCVFYENKFWMFFFFFFAKYRPVVMQTVLQFIFTFIHDQLEVMKILNPASKCQMRIYQYFQEVCTERDLQKSHPPCHTFLLLNN